MDCNICGNSEGVKLYFCEQNDCDICENCIKSNNLKGCDEESCEYRDTCKVYKKLLEMSSSIPILLDNKIIGEKIGDEYFLYDDCLNFEKSNESIIKIHIKIN